MRDLLRALGDRLRKLRERRGISQEDFADRCGLHRTAIGLLERGQRVPRLDTLLIMGRELGVQLTEIVHGIELSPGIVRPSGSRLKASSISRQSMSYSSPSEVKKRTGHCGASLAITPPDGGGTSA